jgi:hypothetical protein
MVHRGTSNTNDRGSAADRRSRRLWLLATFGDGVRARCQLNISSECLVVVDATTLSVDRYPVPGIDGGRYVRGNIRPCCGPCNSLQGAQLGNGRK